MNLDADPSAMPAVKSGALDHAWRYFELHANQRFSVFNFYIALVGLTTAGLGATLQGSARFAALGILLGALITLLSFVFWKLDQRNSMLIKHAEGILEAIEADIVGPGAAVFAMERPAFKRQGSGNSLVQLWTFGKSLRFIFAVMGLLGLAGAALSALRFADVVAWTADQKTSAAAKSGNMPRHRLVPTSVGRADVTSVQSHAKSELAAGKNSVAPAAAEKSTLHGQ